MNLRFWERDTALSFDEWIEQWQMLNYNGHQYALNGITQTMPGDKQEVPSGDFQGFASGLYGADSVVFACNQARLKVFSQARFIFRQLRSSGPGDLFGTADLRILESPWPGAKTINLLARAIQDADLSGNFYAVRRGNQIKRLRPDWVDIILASSGEIDVEVIGYAYYPGGKREDDPVVLRPEQVAHFAPTPDPLASFRGMSWLTPVIREVMADKAATQHKLKFFENGATPNLVVTAPEAITKQEDFDKWMAALRGQNEGVRNAYKTLAVGHGTDVTAVGVDLRQLEFKATQGAGETRIAAAAGVHPVIVGLSEGLQGSSLNSGNFSSARRLFADTTGQYLWQTMAAAIANIVTVPPGSELWFDDRHISFLQDDMKDRAEIQANQATALGQLVNAGWEPDAAVDAIKSDDLGRLAGKHTGLNSVQLQPPGTIANGTGPAPVLTP